MTALVHSCGGTWQPVPGWSGRYRCDRCGVFGYRRGVNDAAYARHLADGQHTREYMVEYRCGVRDCDRGAVKKVGRSRAWRCAEHAQW